MRWFHLLAFWGVVGCVPNTPRAMIATCDAMGDTINTVVFSDEEATNVIDMVDHASIDELTVLEGVGIKAATEMVQNRPYSGDFEPLAVLAELPAVNAEVLLSLRVAAADSWCSQNDGRQSCCVALSCDGMGGWAGSVPVADQEAHVLLEWANNATVDELEVVCGIGPALSKSIVDARPIRTMNEVDDVNYMGATTIQRILGREGFECEQQETIASSWCAVDGNCLCPVD